MNCITRNRMLALRLFGVALICFFALGVGPSAKADALYTFSDPADGISWSFVVPGIIVNQSGEAVTITDFLSTSVLPLANPTFIPTGCTTVDSVWIYWTTGNGEVATTLSGEGACSSPPAQGIGIEFGRIDSFGSYTFSGLFQGNLDTWTLTISQVPEPASLLLLGTALLGLVGVGRRKLASYGGGA